MVTGRQLEAQARRFDRALRVLEREAVRSLDGALRQAAIRLEDELRRLYTPALRAGTAESLAYREARARMLLAQVQSLMLVTDHVPAEGALTQLLRDSYAAGAADGASLLGMYGQQAVAMHAVVPESVIIAATNASARLAHRGAQFAGRAEQIIIDGLIRGQGFRRTAAELRRETGITRYSAERIIYTESIRASDSGRQATYEASGIQHVQLYATLDDRVCFHCASRAGAVFKLGDIEVPLHPHCRCYLGPWKKEWQDAGLTDDAWFAEHREKTLARATGPKHTGPSPSEKWQGIEEAPKPVWTPGGSP